MVNVMFSAGLLFLILMINFIYFHRTIPIFDKFPRFEFYANSKKKKKNQISYTPYLANEMFEMSIFTAINITFVVLS